MWRPSARGASTAPGRTVRAGRAVGRAIRPIGRAFVTVGRPAVQAAGGHLEILLVLLAAIMFAIGWPTMSLTQQVTPSLQPLLTVLEVAPILVFARSAFYAWVVSIGGALVWLVVPDLAGASMPWPVVHFLILLGTILVAAMFARLPEVAFVVAGSATLFGLALPPDLKPWAFGQALFVAFGLLVRWLVISRRQLARASRETEAERARRAVIEERSRIARELHDVVAHHMSMMVVQAQSAPVRLDGVTPQVAEEFSSIEKSARQALNEVRGVLGVLREESSEQALAPQPGAEDLTGLLESAQAAGVDLTWKIDLGEAELPSGHGLVLHRILQESLANASRHAPGAQVAVSLTCQDQQVRLAVENGPPPRAPVPAWPDEAGGNGLPGMRTRAQALDGTLSAEPTPEGGFRVEAVVPLDGHA